MTSRNRAMNGLAKPAQAVGGRRKTPAVKSDARHTQHSPGTELTEPKVLVVRAAGWDGYTWLRHGFSTKIDGVSMVYGPGSLNLGWTKEDEAASVAENRRRFLNAVAGRQGRLVTFRQFHSAMVRVVEAGDGALEGRLETPEGRAVLRGDGAMTDVPGVMLGVQIADCVPVLVADVKRRAVAAFHAGWRGTVARIVERGIGSMRLRYGSRPEDLIAVVGPSIGSCCYAVGEEVQSQFVSQFAYAGDLFREMYGSDAVRKKSPMGVMTETAPGHSGPGPQIHLNLWEANRRQLLDAGLGPKRIQVLGECTACARVEGGGLKYFSHRGESGFAGRLMGVIGVVAE